MADEPGRLILREECFPGGHGSPCPAIQDGLNQRLVGFLLDVPGKQGRSKATLQRHAVTGTTVLLKKIQQLPLSFIRRHTHVTVLCEQHQRERQQAIE